MRRRSWFRLASASSALVWRTGAVPPALGSTSLLTQRLRAGLMNVAASRLRVDAEISRKKVYPSGGDLLESWGWRENRGKILGKK